MVPVTSVTAPITDESQTQKRETHLSKLRHIDQTGEILEIRTLVVESTKVEVLSTVPLAERDKDIR